MADAKIVRLLDILAGVFVVAWLYMHVVEPMSRKA